MPILCQLPGEDFLLWRLASFHQPHLRIASALRGLASIASRAQCRISSSSATTRGGFLCCTVLCCRTCSLHRHIHLIRFGLEVDSIQNPEAPAALCIGTFIQPPTQWRWMHGCRKTSPAPDAPEHVACPRTKLRTTCWRRC